jgi:hypothetical protein
MANESTDHQIIELNRENVWFAIDIAAQCFPGQLDEVIKYFYSSLKPKTEWKFEGAEEINELKYFLLLYKEEPAGITGYYEFINRPTELWFGWTGISYLFRGQGLVSLLIQDIIEIAEKKKKKIIRGWSENAPRFQDMHLIMRHKNFKPQSFLEDRYFVFSKGINGFETTSCPKDTDMTGGSKNPTKETAFFIQLKNIEKHYTEQKLAIKTSKYSFNKKYRDANSYVQDRLVDLTEQIVTQEQNSQTLSL